MTARRSALRIDIRVADPAWRNAGAAFASELRKAVRLACNAADGAPAGGAGLTILLANDAALHALNARFRRKDKPTNVLSFPSPETDYLGDIAIAYEVTAREAAEAGLALRDHALHLAIHGVLHLLGYDHETARAARTMEPMETAILAKLGIGDPYAARDGRHAAE